MCDLAIPHSAENYDVLVALKTALFALETGPEFEVPELKTDSYAIAATCRRVLVAALKEAQAQTGAVMKDTPIH